ncbi:hypothetical protein M422DRAFT_252951 [Sphaerobolus stellatus SS14]|uniref:Uncharacterized protein n=1 Tax=Sphaerobolus stellatus (strain SS14) TaxID=990650 RepID=A0A0C9VNS7_SPHS4|nr:hypothetical protein M422DRAFT_252951 [Sphaerobolus stellatus SS14]
MSDLLLGARRLSIDTSWKRLPDKWQEFEMEAFFSQYNRSIVVARAYVNSQSADAHLVLFQRIFAIAAADTGREVRIWHIHGDGLDTITADRHRGQAIGWGKFCQSLCRSMAGYCAYEITKPLFALTPSDHLKRCYHYCFLHYTRNVGDLRGYVEEVVCTSMMRLASAEELPPAIYESIIATIRNGGKKAIDWLKDKESADGWALAAIYHPKSKIPLHIWKAAPSTSNGNEQAHRNVNRDGMKLSLLAATMFGEGVDFRQLNGIDILLKHGIHNRDQVQSHFRQAARALIRSAAVQKRTIEGHDSELQNSYSELSKLQNEAVTQNATLKRVREDGHDAGPPKSKLRTTEKKYTELYLSLSALQARSSGRVEAPELPHPSLLIPQPPQPLPPLQMQSQQTLWSDKPQGNYFGVQQVSAYSIQSPSTNFGLGSSTTSPSHSSNQVPFRTASTYPPNTITSQQYEFGHEFTYANYSHQGLYQGYPPNTYTPDSHYSPEGSQCR